MIAFDAVVRLVQIDAGELNRWIEESWVRPAQGEGGYVFEEVDVARIRLIIELRRDLAIDDEAIPVVLGLLDQIYRLRRRLKALSAAVEAQAPEVREQILALLASEPTED
jgi:chaperone modulatory protein CbpM